MRKRLSLVAATVLAGATMSMTAASPAQAQTCYSPGDPVMGFVCTIVNNAPEPGPTINHYYYTAFEIADFVYCTVSPGC